MVAWTEARLHDEFKRDKVIGRGRYGQAVLWRARTPLASGLLAPAVVVKTVALELLSEKERQQTTNEVALLSALKHPNVIGILGAFMEPTTCTMNLVLEAAECGTLADALRRHAFRKEPLEPLLVRHWFAELALAVEHVHGARILHRDIKTANIFLTSSQSIKLGDFGVSRQLSESRSMATTCVGTPFSLSPELVRGQAYGAPADLWALGVVLFEMLTLQRPFIGGNIGELVINISHGRINGGHLTPPLLESCADAELRELVMGMLEADADKRLTMKQIMASRCLRDALESAPEMRALLAPSPPPSVDGRDRAADAPDAPTSSARVTSPEHEGKAAHASPALARLTLARASSGSDVALPGQHDFACVRDSVSDAARRERRRRSATGSPSLSVCTLVRHMSSASVAADASGTLPPHSLLPTRTASCPFGLGRLRSPSQFRGRVGSALAVAAAPPRCMRARSVIEHL